MFTNPQSLQMCDIIHIGDDPFKISYMDFNSDMYEEMLDKKVAKVIAKLPNAIRKQLHHTDIIRSPVRYFRQRCRFAISHRLNSSNVDCSSTASDSSSHASFSDGDIKTSCTEISSAAPEETGIQPARLNSGTGTHLTYTLWENGGPNIDVDSFPIASRIIYDTMPIMLSYLQTIPELNTNLRAINFLSTLSGDLIATLVYEHELDCIWKQKATEMHGRLGSKPFCCLLLEATWIYLTEYSDVLASALFQNN